MTRFVADINAEIRDIVERLGAHLPTLGSGLTLRAQDSTASIILHSHAAEIDCPTTHSTCAFSVVWQRMAEIETRAPVSWAVDAPAEGSAP